MTHHFINAVRPLHIRIEFGCSTGIGFTVVSVISFEWANQNHVVVVVLSQVFSFTTRTQEIYPL